MARARAHHDGVAPRLRGGARDHLGHRAEADLRVVRDAARIEDSRGLAQRRLALVAMQVQEGAAEVQHLGIDVHALHVEQQHARVEALQVARDVARRLQRRGRAVRWQQDLRRHGMASPGSLATP